MNHADTLRQLIEKEEIQDTLIRYAHAQDRKDWQALEAFLTEDVRGEYGGVEYVEGRQALLDTHRRYLDACGTTQHLLSNFRIEVRGDRASSACYLRGMHAGIGRQAGKVYDIWAEYRDEWVRTAEGWKICKRIEDTHYHSMDYREFFNP